MDFNEKLSAFEGSRVLIIGAGKSGIAAASLLSRVSDRIVVSDIKSAEEVPGTVARVKRLGGIYIGGEQNEDLLEGIDFVVRSPGVKWDIPVLVAAVEKGYKIVGELELAYRLLPSNKVIAVTGSNGKSTTTVLIGAMLNQAGKQYVVAGNVGRPLCDAILEIEKDTVVVLEVSSFQLEDIEEFRPKVGILLNLTPDHIDHHGSEEEYYKQKWRLFENQTKQDYAVINADDVRVYNGKDDINGHILLFGSGARDEEGCWVENRELVYRFHRSEGVIIKIEDIRLTGAHNLENAMAAVCAAIAMGVSSSSIAKTLMKFKGLAHRLEKVREIGNISYVNDSKATNIASAIVGMQAFDEPIVLIAGGKHKGGSFAELVSTINKKCRAVITYGEAGPQIADEIAGAVSVSRVKTISEAVQKANLLAEPGDIVLLSPACTSWDQYKSFEDRGEDFKKCVMELK